MIQIRCRPCFSQSSSGTRRETIFFVVRAQLINFFTGKSLITRNDPSDGHTQPRLWEIRETRSTDEISTIGSGRVSGSVAKRWSSGSSSAGECHHPSALGIFRTTLRWRVFRVPLSSWCGISRDHIHFVTGGRRSRECRSIGALPNPIALGVFSPFSVVELPTPRISSQKLPYLVGSSHDRHLAGRSSAFIYHQTPMHSTASNAIYASNT